MIVVLWALILAAAAVVAPQVFGALEPGGFSSSDFESQRTAELLTQRLGYFPGALVVLFSVPPGSGLRNDQPAFIDQMNDALAQVRALPEVAFVTTPREMRKQERRNAELHARAKAEFKERRARRSGSGGGG